MILNIALYAVNLRTLLLNYVISVVPTLQLWIGIMPSIYSHLAWVMENNEFFDFVFSR